MFFETICNVFHDMNLMRLVPTAHARAAFTKRKEIAKGTILPVGTSASVMSQVKKRIKSMQQRSKIIQHEMKQSQQCYCNKGKMKMTTLNAERNVQKLTSQQKALEEAIQELVSIEYVHLHQ